MKRLQKQSVLFLLIALLVTSFSACQRPETMTAELWMSTAEAYLEEADYTATVTTAFSSAQEQMAQSVASMQSSNMTVRVSGESFSADMQVKTASAEVNRSYVMTGGYLYHSNTLKVGEDAVTVKEKAPASALDLYLTLEAVSVGASIDSNDFSNLSMTSDETKHRVTCTGIRNNALVELNEILGVTTDASKLIVNSVTYEAVIENSKFVETALTVVYTVMTGTEIYELTATRTASYTYESVAVTSPADAEDYTAVSYEELIK